VTVNVNNITVLLVDTGGAVNVAIGEVGLFSVTAGPAFCVHKYVSVPPRGSVLACPSSVTVVPSLTVWSGLTTTIAVGGGFVVDPLTVILTNALVRVNPWLSVAVYVKASGPTYPVIGVYLMLLGLEPLTLLGLEPTDIVPCNGLSSRVNVIVFPGSGSVPVRVISIGVFSFVVTVLGLGRGG
jgi:hypothetical protein